MGLKLGAGPTQEGFSYNVIPESRTITIPEYNQMNVHETLWVNGTLTIEGELSIRN